MKTENKTVYITNANFNRLVYALSKNYSLKKILSDSEFELTDILNSMELAHVEHYRNMLKDDRLSDVLEKNSHDTTGHKKNYEVFPLHQYKPPAMHISLNCQMMLSDYSGLDVPKEIKKDSELLAKYIEWYKVPEIQNLVRSNRMTEFYDIQEAEFQTRDKLVPFTLENSGVASLFTLEENKKSIINLLSAAKEYRNSSQEHQNLIKKKGYGTNREYVRNSDPILEGWHFKYKKRLMNLLKSYYRVQTNLTLEFDHELLKKVGFRDCRTCM